MTGIRDVRESATGVLGLVGGSSGGNGLVSSFRGSPGRLMGGSVTQRAPGCDHVDAVARTDEDALLPEL